LVEPGEPTTSTPMVRHFHLLRGAGARPNGHHATQQGKESRRLIRFIGLPEITRRLDQIRLTCIRRSSRLSAKRSFA